MNTYIVLVSSGSASMLLTIQATTTAELKTAIQEQMPPRELRQVQTIKIVREDPMAQVYP